MSTENTIPAALESPEVLISCILDMGELLMSSGAEVLRVEDTLSRLCSAYEFSRINVFSITSSIVLTVQSPDGKIYTQTRRIQSRSTDLRKITLVNALSREICRAPLSIQSFQERITGIKTSKNFPLWVQCLFYAVNSTAFSIFFGGTFWDGFAAAISGVILFFALCFVQKLRMNSILQCLLVSACTALSVVLLVRLGIGDSPEKITIGNIMLLIPGVSFTTSVRDLINGDTISGLIGISEAIIKAIAIAIGFAAILVQMGGAV